MLAFAPSCNQAKAKRFFSGDERPSFAIDRSTEFRKVINNQLDTFFLHRSFRNGFNGSALVVLNGKPVYEGYFGYADYRSRDTVTQNTAFQLASVSKTITATAVLILVQKGLIGLDDTLQKYFPKFPYKAITVQHLLCHRSGLPNYLYFDYKWLPERGKYMSNADMMAIIETKKPGINRLPNRAFEYCNTNYAILASLVEAVSGQSFADFVEDNIFTPLEMTHSFVYDAFAWRNKEHSKNYNSKWEEQKNDCFDGVVGDKGTYSTVRDMYLFEKALRSGRLLTEETMAEAYKPRSNEHKGIRNYGYGWRMTQQPDSSWMIFHNGWWHGNNTAFQRRINDSTCIIILSNKFNKTAYNTAPIWSMLYKNTGPEEAENCE